MAEITKPNMANLWASSGAIIEPSSSKVLTGWTAEIPPHQWENWVQNRQDQAIGYLYQHGIAGWDATTEYFGNRSAVILNGRIYLATADSVNQNPTTATTFWAQVAIVTTNTSDAGQVSYFARNSAPTGYLKANGAAVSVTTYPNLTTAIYVGDTNNATALFGYRCTDSANPSTTRSITGAFIVLPDLRGEFIRSWDDGRNIDGSRAFGTWQKATLVAGDYTGTTSPALRSILNGDDTQAAFITRFGGDLIQTSDYTNLVVANTASGAAIAVDNSQVFGVRPRNISLLACIKY